MSSYIIPASITPRPIKPKLIMVEIVEAIMDAGPCAILPVAGDCLEGVDVVDGGWVAVDFTRRPAPPRYRSKGGDGSSDLCPRQELESITQETAIYIEGAGIAQLQWGGLEIAEGCRDGYLYCKHIKPFAMELYGKYWTAWDGPPEREGTT